MLPCHDVIMQTKILFKSPWITGGGGTYCFLVCFRRRRHLRCRRCSANTFQLSGKTPEANCFKPHMVNLWVWKNFSLPISVNLGQGQQTTKAGQILPCPHDKVRIAHPIATKFGRYIPLVMLSWLNSRPQMWPWPWKVKCEDLIDSDWVTSDVSVPSCWGKN